MRKIVILTMTFMGAVYGMDNGKPPQKQADMKAMQDNPSGTLFSQVPKDLFGGIEDHMGALEKLQKKLDEAESIEEFIAIANADPSSKMAPVSLDLSKCNRPFRNIYVQNKELKLMVELFPNMRELNLTNSRALNNAGLAPLAGLKHLESLYLNDCFGLTDAGLVHLVGLKQLQKLNLIRVTIRGEGLAYLKGLTQLKELTLWRGYNPDMNAIDDLKKALPNLIVTVTEGYSEESEESEETD